MGTKSTCVYVCTPYDTVLYPINADHHALEGEMDGRHDDTALCVPLTTSRDPSSLGKDRQIFLCVGGVFYLDRTTRGRA